MTGKNVSSRCYAVRAVIDLAVHQGPDPVSLHEIAQRQDIPEHYLAYLMGPLVSAGIVRRFRGMKGGFSLSTAPSRIRLGDIFRIYEGSFLVTDCIRDTVDCSNSPSCSARDLYLELNDAIYSFLDSITLDRLVQASIRISRLPEPPAAHPEPVEGSAGANQCMIFGKSRVGVRVSKNDRP